MENVIDVTHFDNMSYFDTFVKPKVANSLVPVMTDKGTVGAPTYCN
jgi:hypothetical protein